MSNWRFGGKEWINLDFIKNISVKENSMGKFEIVTCDDKGDIFLLYKEQFESKLEAINKMNGFMMQIPIT